MDMRPEEDQVDLLNKGLSKMPINFTATICSGCNGAGEYKQTYNAGCGMGSYQSMGDCDWCKGCGLTTGHEPSPHSVRNQVLEAASR